MELNKIYNEDCLAGLRQIQDGSIDLCVTDPPYWHKKSPGKPYSERRQCNTKSAFSNSELYNYDGDMIKGMSDFDDKCIDAFLTALVPKMKIMNAYIFCLSSVPKPRSHTTPCGRNGTGSCSASWSGKSR